MEDVNISKFRAQVVRAGSTPASPGFVVSEGQNPVDPSGSGQNHLPVTIAEASTGLSITESQVLGGAGTVSQYIRGDGSLADFPSITGGGSSVSYYLNGSVSQGTIGGVAYRELNRTPVFGAGTDISINADGYIASFITDAGDPNKLLIPAGNWNFETYFSASSSGGSPSFYVELYKYDGTTFTLIASSSTSPELIAFGTSLNPYFSTLAVPQTTLALTDRLAIRFYVNHSGRTITLHTEDNHLCQIITSFTTGLTALNNLTTQVQFFAVGTSGSDFNIASSVDTHTFNLPTASGTNRGALSSTDWTTFNNKENAITAGTTAQYFRGDKTFQTLNTSVVPEGTNLYYTEARVNANTNVAANTAARHNAVTLGTANGLSLSTQVLSLGLASAGVTGALSGTDWSTFNNKQNALNGTGFVKISGTTISYDNTNYLPLTGGTLTGTLNINGLGYGNTLVITTNNTGGADIRLNNTSSGGKIYNITSTGSGNAIGAGGLQFYNETDGVVAFGYTSTRNFVINTSSDNGSRLRVNGTGFFDSTVTSTQFIANGNSTGGFEGLRIINASTGAAQILLNNSAQSWLVNTRTDNNFSIFNNTSSTTPFFISTTGNVGIGTTSPNSISGYNILTINNSTYGGLIDFANNNTLQGRIGADQGGVYLQAKTNIPMSFSTNDTERMRITNGGAFLINRTTNVSDTVYKFIVKNSTDVNIGFGIVGGEATIEAFNDAINAATPLRIYASKLSMGLNGNVLIGTTTDAGFKLDVNGTARFSGADGADLIRYNATGVNTNFATKIVSGANDVLVFRRQHSSVGALDIMALGYNGNVGIGTTSPLTNLTVRGSATNTMSLQYSSDGGGVGYGIHNAAGNELFSIGGGRFVRQDELSISRQGTSVIYINNSNNVGIGTTSPGFKLDVNGKIYSSTEVQGGSALMNLTGGYATFGSNSSVVGIRVGRDASFNDIIINPSGNVAIGTTTDNGYRLNNTGNTWSNGVRIGRDFSISNRATVRLDSNGDQPADILFGRTPAALQSSWDGVFWSLSSRGSGESNVFNIYRGLANTGGSELVVLSCNPSGNVNIGTTTDNGNRLRVNGVGFFDQGVRTGQPVGTTTNNWLLGRALASGTSTPDRWIRVQIGLEYYDILAVYMGTL